MTKNDYIYEYNAFGWGFYFEDEREFVNSRGGELNMSGEFFKRFEKFGVTKEKIQAYWEKGFQSYDQLMIGLDNGLTIEEVEIFIELDRNSLVEMVRELLEKKFPKDKIIEFVELTKEYELEPFELTEEEIIELLEKDSSIEEIKSRLDLNNFKYKIEKMIESSRRIKRGVKEREIIISRFKEIEEAYINTPATESKEKFDFPFINMDIQYLEHLRKDTLKELAREDISIFEFLELYRKIVDSMEVVF